jgi:hypothetical protein
VPRTHRTPLYSDQSTHRNSGILINALKNRFNVTATASGRNDILVDGKKISGAAYKISGGVASGFTAGKGLGGMSTVTSPLSSLLSSDQKALHHGTMLINVDFTALGKILNPDKAKLKVHVGVGRGDGRAETQHPHPKNENQTPAEQGRGERAGPGAEPEGTQSRHKSRDHVRCAHAGVL